MGLEEELGITMGKERAKEIATVQHADVLIEELIQQKTALVYIFALVFYCINLWTTTKAFFQINQFEEQRRTLMLHVLLESTDTHVVQSHNAQLKTKALKKAAIHWLLPNFYSQFQKMKKLH